MTGRSPEARLEKLDMKQTILLGTLLMGMLLSGCTTIRENVTQYQIVGPTGERGIRLPVTAADRQAAKEIVSAYGNQWRLKDRTASSFLANVIAQYGQDWNETRYPMSLMAFEDKGKVVINFSHSSPEMGETELYRRRSSALFGTLQQKFGARAVMAPLIDHVRHVPGTVTTEK